MSRTVMGGNVYEVFFYSIVYNIILTDVAELLHKTVVSEAVSLIYSIL